MTDIWDGQWVADNVGITLTSELGGTIETYVGLALRHNSKRAHLLVSHYLGKHIPTDPRVVYGAGLQLGQLVAQEMFNHSPGNWALGDEPPLVMGYAETATGLGHAVADFLDAPFLHSTRRPVTGVRLVGGFEEEHSHATGHLLLPENAELLADGRALVLVDDELSTGQTISNTIRAVHATYPRALYLVTVLANVCGLGGYEQMEALAEELSTDELTVKIVNVDPCLATINLPSDVIERAEQVLAAHADVTPSGAAPSGAGARERSGSALITMLRDLWPVGVRDGGRHGFDHDDRFQSAIAARGVAAAVAEYELGARILVLGFEELMHAPVLIAVALAFWAEDEHSVLFSSTTRSPVQAIDAPGYPIRTALRFPAHDNPADGPGPRFAYNVAPAAGAEPFTDIVLVVDDVADTPELHADDGLLAQLAGVCERVYVVVVPSYRPDPA